MDRMTMGFFSDPVRNPVNPVHPVQYSSPGLTPFSEHRGPMSFERLANYCTAANSERKAYARRSRRITQIRKAGLNTERTTFFSVSSVPSCSKNLHLRPSAGNSGFGCDSAALGQREGSMPGSAANASSPLRECGGTLASGICLA